VREQVSCLSSDTLSVIYLYASTKDETFWLPTVNTAVDDVCTMVAVIKHLWGQFVLVLVPSDVRLITGALYA
jgi:hypothetical protein